MASWKLQGFSPHTNNNTVDDDTNNRSRNTATFNPSSPCPFFSFLSFTFMPIPFSPFFATERLPFSGSEADRSHDKLFSGDNSWCQPRRAEKAPFRPPILSHTLSDPPLEERFPDLSLVLAEDQPKAIYRIFSYWMTTSSQEICTL